MTAATPQGLAPGPVPEARPAPAARLGRWHGRQLDPRRNGLNAVRLALAVLVLHAHTYYITGRGVGPHVDGENLGGWAVFGFFAISGYLITGSRWRNGLAPYLVHRVARIFPAFVVCLVVMVVAVGPVGYLALHGTLSGYLTTPTTPANFVFSNLFLHMNAYDIAGTPGDVPYPGAWNGSLWSLYYEFLCYLVVGLLALIGFFRRSVWALAGAWVLSVLGHAGWTHGVGTLLGGNSDAQLLLKLLPLFLGGALVERLRHRLPLHWAAAAVSVAGVAVAVWALDGWGAQLTAPLLAYALIWFGSVLPIPGLLRRHDVSYGIYIYAFPVQQLLAVAGASTLPLLVFDATALALTVPLAVASWLVVERPAMRWARRSTTPQRA
ncbi:acyltransferase [Cellulomonas hominis]|uniref:Acyltransferase n=1 Tax=Cellulomonas hominis TaxID=156981 RepID=A0A511F7D0_9CELL|nr:acyltransferase [Cellulomonas hominis]MBB5474026.1 peptidoglycan/LPS O-acetylase OafA/YrhL [Cellulomonas hominis]NKY08665.1 acyltransferase [Cellulomonas hominis]GEL45179.1 acyltransferase [Cellulomonas hominis]